MVNISVIMPVCAGDDYLERCLDSVTKQTLKDIEIICICDESGTVDEYASKDSRISVQTNMNRAIDMAKGEYVYFIDTKDSIKANALKKLYENAKSNDSDIVLFDSVEEKKNSQRDLTYMPRDRSIDYGSFTFDYTYEQKLVMNRMLVAGTKIYKASFIRDNALGFRNQKIFNDIEFHIKSMILAKRISYLPEKLHTHDRKSPLTEGKERYCIFNVFDNVESFLEEKGLWQDFRTDFYEFKIKLSKANLDWTSQEYKEEYYQILRNEFLEMDIDPKDLELLPGYLYKFYMFALNFEVHELYKKFNRLKKTPGKYIDKNAVQEEIDAFNGVGINEDKRNPRIIVSLTSYPKRMYDIHFCLYSLLKQNFKPDEVILWLAEEEFPNGEDDIPQDVLNLKENGLTIKWCENLKSYKKLLPSLKEYPDDFIVTADDDLFYPEDWLERIWECHLKYPNCIISQRARRLGFNPDNSLKPYRSWSLIDKDIPESYLNLPTGAGGILYPPKIFSDLIFERKLYEKLAQSTDDLWFWAMAVINLVKIKAVPKSNMVFLCYVNFAREYGFLDEKSLWYFNSTGGNVDSLERILDYYPEILDIINLEENGD